MPNSSTEKLPDEKTKILLAMKEQVKAIIQLQKTIEQQLEQSEKLLEPINKTLGRISKLLKIFSLPDPAALLSKQEKESLKLAQEKLIDFNNRRNQLQNLMYRLLPLIGFCGEFSQQVKMTVLYIEEVELLQTSFDIFQSRLNHSNQKFLRLTAGLNLKAFTSLSTSASATAQELKTLWAVIKLKLPKPIEKQKDKKTIKEQMHTTIDLNTICDPLPTASNSFAKEEHDTLLQQMAGFLEQDLLNSRVTPRIAAQYLTKQARDIPPQKNVALTPKPPTRPGTARGSNKENVRLTTPALTPAYHAEVLKTKYPHAQNPLATQSKFLHQRPLSQKFPVLPVTKSG